MIVLTCANCDTQFSRYPTQIRRPAKYRFCSRQCQNTHQGRREALAKSERVRAGRVVPDSEQPPDHRVVRLKSGELTRVDPADYDLALRHPWFMHTQGYAYSGSKYYLHRLVLERMAKRPLTRKDVADHKNHDKLDNRRCNLRLATVALNGGNMLRPAHNTTGYKGVMYKPKACKSRPWQASIKVDQHNYFIGFFATAIDAAYAYDQWATQVFGEFAHTNVL